MRKTMSYVLALVAAAFFAGSALAADPPPPKPFPSPAVKQVFVAAETVATDGTARNIFAPGESVVFRAYSVDPKTKKALVAKDVRYFYAEIPNQPTLKLKYNQSAPGATKRYGWTGVWKVPTDYAVGPVKFRVLVQTVDKRKGQFVQFPVAPAELTISTSVPSVPKGPVTAASDEQSSDLSLYVDTVAGTRTAPGVAKRPVGCTQSNVYKRGEDVVFRAWGVDLTTDEVLSTDNVDSATVTVPGLAAMKLNYGAHGSTNAKVLFWSLGWIIPADYPLGNTTGHVTFTTDAGKTGSFDYAFTVIP